MCTLHKVQEAEQENGREEVCSVWLDFQADERKRASCTVCKKAVKAVVTQQK